MPSNPRTIPPDAGFAIGAILFVIALIAIIATVIAAGTGDFGSASITDRVAADVATQANLIRSKIVECNMLYGTNSNGDGYPSSGGSSVLVSSLSCAGDPVGMQNLWSGERVALLPPPTHGFGPWYYINTNNAGLGGTATGGRCIWTEPAVTASPGIINGLTKAATKFANSSVYDSAYEVIYDPASASQKFIVWITMPTSGTPVADCLP